ncbi:hypothetical protein RF11_00583 [Thelohanellus kitauei]|uniref:Uncharacterized protein n=1 Tax=Thelohanellus kitauei TaxID=669202 RepID=A0A0C2JTK8_THEKT|nr:hypothetical protein RF11_00583 [Thelohanellus kitauei]
MIRMVYLFIYFENPPLDSSSATGFLMTDVNYAASYDFAKGRQISTKSQPELAKIKLIRENTEKDMSGLKTRPVSRIDVAGSIMPKSARGRKRITQILTDSEPESRTGSLLGESNQKDKSEPTAGTSVRNLGTDAEPPTKTRRKQTNSQYLEDKRESTRKYKLTHKPQNQEEIDAVCCKKIVFQS